MTVTVAAVCFAADDPPALARFWAALLDGRASVDGCDGDVTTVRLADDPGFALTFRPAVEPKQGQNQAHFDLTSLSAAGQQQTVARALELGARHIDIGQREDEGHIVLADPEGNEFCVIEPGNRFLAGCGFLGAVSCVGTRANGYFWTAALDWPLVWDQDEETAIQSSRGGAKLTWGGWRHDGAGRNRLHFELTAEDRDTDVERLVGLGASRLDVQDESGRVLLADPDGNEFCLG